MRILFVCTGNTCRSPMAEGLFRRMAATHRLSVEIRSAGVSAMDGQPISRHAAAVLKNKQIYDQLSSSSLKREDVEWAELVLTMTEGHKLTVIGKHPHTADKVYTLKEFVEDGGQTLADIEELERLYAEFELNRSLREPIAPALIARIRELEARIPDFNISDPFGGSLAVYEQCAAELERSLEKLADKMKRNRSKPQQ